MTKLLAFLLAILASTHVHAHVGSPDVYYEADAGPYHLFVTVRLPQVIPGVAEIQVRSASPDVQTIQIVPLRLSGPGSDLPAVPEVTQRSKEDPQFFVGKLWFMEVGALRVRMDVEGARGKGELSVPIAAFGRQRLRMDQGLRVLLPLCVVFFTLSVVVSVGPIIRETTVPPGEAPQASNRRYGRIATVLAVILSVVTLGGSAVWWVAEVSTHDRNVNLLKPPRAETTLVDGNRLVIRPASQVIIPGGSKYRLDRAVDMDKVIPDHGHVMHLFLIRLPGMDRMWHLHPDHAEGGAFAERLPAMPAGQYKLFADIVDNEGYPWTFIGDVDLPQIDGTAPVGDDSNWEGERVATRPSKDTEAQLPDGGRVVWERGDGALIANAPASLKFLVKEKDGSPARGMEPYMGMVGHAQVVCSDLSVFAHIHPSGSVSMAALDLAQGGLMAQSANGASGMAMETGMVHSSGPLPAEVKFPYGFPHPGDYRVFVQVKRFGKVQTAAFDAHVQ